MRPPACCATWELPSPSKKVVAQRAERRRAPAGQPRHPDERALPSAGSAQRRVALELWTARSPSVPVAAASRLRGGRRPAADRRRGAHLPVRARRLRAGAAAGTLAHRDAIGVVASGLAHDLNRSLNVIALRIATLRADRASGPPGGASTAWAAWSKRRRRRWRGCRTWRGGGATGPPRALT